jgi:hypothetical protein
MLVESFGVALQSAFVLKSAFDEVEGDFRQPPLSHAMQVFDIDGLIDPHARVISWTRQGAARQHCEISHRSTIPHGAGLSCALGASWSGGNGRKVTNGIHGPWQYRIACQRRRPRLRRVQPAGAGAGQERGGRDSNYSAGPGARHQSVRHRGGLRHRGGARQGDLPTYPRCLWWDAFCRRRTGVYWKISISSPV